MGPSDASARARHHRHHRHDGRRFAKALAKLELPPATVDEAFEEARRRYSEIVRSRPRAAVA